MQTSFNTLKSLIMVGIVTTSSPMAVAAVPNTFNPGDVITADGMNQNFSALDNKDSLQDNAITALQNRTDMLPSIKITNDNIDSLDIPENTLIIIDEKITVPPENALKTGKINNIDGLSSAYSGGLIGQSEDVQIKLSNGSIIKNLHIENITIDGMDLVFENCKFTGNVKILHDATIKNSEIDLATINTSYGMLSIVSSDIRRSIIETMTNIINSNFLASVIQRAWRMTSSNIENTLVLDGGKEMLLNSNIIEDSTIKLSQVRSKIISSNSFDGTFDGLSNIGANNSTSFPAENYMINTTISGSAYANIRITNNSFW